MAFRYEEFGDAKLYLGDCLEVIPLIGKVSHTISDPPYDEVMQVAFDKVGRMTNAKHLSKREPLSFQAVDSIRIEVAKAIVTATDGWAILFTIAEGVGSWRDALEDAKARYKRAMVWIKPDAMPQFNGQGPSIGHEMMVSAWCGAGYSRWGGGGRVGTFYHTKERDRVHPTQKPLPLMRELVGLFSFPGEIILDPFAGSATTGVACIELGRKFIGIEKDKKTFDLACKRLAESHSQPRLALQEMAKQPQLFDEVRSEIQS